MFATRSQTRTDIDLTTTTAASPCKKAFSHRDAELAAAAADDDVASNDISRIAFWNDRVVEGATDEASELDRAVKKNNV